MAELARWLLLLGLVLGVAAMHVVTVPSASARTGVSSSASSAMTMPTAAAGSTATVSASTTAPEPANPQASHLFAPTTGATEPASAGCPCCPHALDAAAICAAVPVGGPVVPLSWGSASPAARVAGAPAPGLHNGLTPPRWVFSPPPPSPAELSLLRI